VGGKIKLIRRGFILGAKKNKSFYGESSK